MRHYPSLDEIEEPYLRDRPEEIEPYLEEIFEDFECDGDVGALLASLQVIVRVRGFSTVAKQVNMTPQDLQNVFARDSNPSLEKIEEIVRAIRYSPRGQHLSRGKNQHIVPHAKGWAVMEELLIFRRHYIQHFVKSFPLLFTEEKNCAIEKSILSFTICCLYYKSCSRLTSQASRFIN